VFGLLLLNGMPDEVVRQRWVYDSYFQRFIGLEFFQHAVPARAFSLQPMARRQHRRLTAATSNPRRWRWRSNRQRRTHWPACKSEDDYSEPTAHGMVKKINRPSGLSSRTKITAQGSARTTLVSFSADRRNFCGNCFIVYGSAARKQNILVPFWLFEKRRNGPSMPLRLPRVVNCGPEYSI
jgi:hypothetical protein